jgi:hypothetical protein
LTVFALVSVGQADNVYISYTGLGEGMSAMDNTSMTGDLGDVVTAHVWYDLSASGQEIDTGIRLDIASSDAAVSSFQSAMTVNPEIQVGGVPINRRWTDLAGVGGANSDPTIDAADLISDFSGFRVSGGTGIRAQNAGPTFFDAGYEDGNGFYLGSFTFIATGGGTTSFTAAPWDDPSTMGGTEGAIVNAGGEVALNYGSASFTVNAIPEPTTAGLLAMGLVGLVSRRRR